MAFLGVVVGIVLSWPQMAIVCAIGLVMAADASVALRTQRKGVHVTLVFDITMTGIALVAADVAGPAVGMVVAYYVLVLAVLGTHKSAWPIGLYTVGLGVVVALANDAGTEPSVVRSAVSGIMVVAIFGISTIAVTREFVAARRRGKETAGRRLEVAQAIADASKVLVSEEEADALSSALEVIREAVDASAVFVERNSLDSEGSLVAELVERSLDGTTSHASLDRRSRLGWDVMPGARAHLEGGAPFFYRIEELRGTPGDRGGEGGLNVEADFPIMLHGEWVGVVGVADTDPDRVWKSDDIVLLRTIADLTAAFWQRVDQGRQRDSLIGTLDDRLQYEEGMARASQALLGEHSSGISDALAAVGSATHSDEVFVTSTVPGPDGEPVASVVAIWADHGVVPPLEVGDRVSYDQYPEVRDAFVRGEVGFVTVPTRSSLASAIHVGGAWSGSVALVSHNEARRWTPRDESFIGTIAEIMGAYYERAQTRERLESSLSSKDQLIGSVSHELRTPLTAVVGLAEELRAAGETFDLAMREELLGMIATESSEMVALVEDLLVAARSEDGNLPVFPERVDLALLAQGVVSSLQVPEGVTIEVDDVDSVAFGDPVRIRQILRNLFTNALRYGGPEISASFGTSDGIAWAEVHDNGQGIGEQDRASIFEPYGRASGGTTVKASVGLGLTLSRRLARIMDGDLRCVPADGGATFRLEVPLPEMRLPEPTPT